MKSSFKYVCFMYREMRSKTKLTVTQTFAHVYSARVEVLGRRIVLVVVLINTHNILVCVTNKTVSVKQLVTPPSCISC